MPKVRLTVIEGDLSVDELARLVLALGGEAPVVAPVVLPAGVKGQQATLRTPERVEPPAAVEVVPVAPLPTADVVRWPSGVPSAPVTDTPTSSEVIQQTLALDAEPAPVPTPKAAPAPAAEQKEAVAAAPSAPLALAGCRKLRDVLEALRGQGFTTPEALVGECQRLRADVPILARIAADQIDERVRRTLEGMA